MIFSIQTCFILQGQYPYNQHALQGLSQMEEYYYRDPYFLVKPYKTPQCKFNIISIHTFRLKPPCVKIYFLVNSVKQMTSDRRNCVLKGQGLIISKDDPQLHKEFSRTSEVERGTTRATSRPAEDNFLKKRACDMNK